MTFSLIKEIILQIITTFSSCLSILGCSVVLYKLLFSNTIWNITNKQLLILCYIDLITAFFWGIGQYGNVNYYLCQIQGFMIQWGGLANIFWNSAIAYHLYQWIVLKYNAEKLDQKIKITSICCIFFTFIISLYLLFVRAYGDAELWCWIDHDGEWYRLGFLYGFLLIAWFFNAYIIHIVSKSLSQTNRNRNQYTSNHLAMAEIEIQKKLRQYLFVFILSWFFGLFNRLMQIILGRSLFITSLLHTLFVPLQGFLNAICYGDILSDFWSQGTSLSEISLTSSSFILSPQQSITSTPSFSPANLLPHISSISATNLLNRMSLISTELPTIKYIPKHYSFFITTFNQGEATIKDMISDIPGWLPNGHDIYVIGVQECLYLSEFRNSVWEYLGGKCKFYQYCTEIGNTNTRLGYHGYIALTVYIKSLDIDMNNIKVMDSNTSNVKTGTDLIVTTAPNKGAVGLSFQIHNTSIGFITAHLPSDSSGKSKMLRRNEVAQNVMQEVILADEDTGCDVHFQHDHLIILGDLNYRLNPTITTLENLQIVSQTDINPSQYKNLVNPNNNQNILLNVTSATFTERNNYSIDDMNWYNRKYLIFEGYLSSNYLSDSDREMILRFEETAHNEWIKVIESDELLYWMKNGEIFYGFHEMPIHFPPTYKRKKGIYGFCGDYTNYGEVIQGFSNLAENEENSNNTNNSGSNNDSEMNNNNSNNDNENSKIDFSDNSERKENIYSYDNESTERIQSKESSINTDNTTISRIGHTRNRSDISSLASNTTISSSTNSAIDGSKTKPARRATLFTLIKNDSIDEKKKSKLRPPSYTDRILYHSLIENNPKLQPVAYGICDTMRASDHRPVCMALNLEVNSNIIPSSGIIKSNNRNILNAHVVVLQLIIKDFQISYLNKSSFETMNPILDNSNHEQNLIQPRVNISELNNPTTSSNQSSSRNSKSHPIELNNLQIIFPISSKDPLNQYRKIYDLSKALNLNDRTGLRLINSKSTKLKEELLQSKRIYLLDNASSSKGIIINSCIDLSTSVEAVIILIDSNGKEYGQGLLHLTPYLQQDQLNVPQIVQQIPFTSGGKLLGYFSATCLIKQVPTQISLR